VACEFSGTVRDAFLARGFDAMSCDLLPTEVPGPHYQGDVFDVLGDGWDLMVAHPPCTFMANSGARWLYRDGQPYVPRWEAMREGAEFFRALWEHPGIPRVAVENPVMVGHAQRIIGTGPTQVVQPWMFGEGQTKGVALWLRGLPSLSPTDVVEGREARVHRMPPGPDRWRERSRFFPGIAAAMADQWGAVLREEVAA
jgi:hypothetical protein